MLRGPFSVSNKLCERDDVLNLRLIFFFFLFFLLIIVKKVKSVYWCRYIIIQSQSLLLIPPFRLPVLPQVFLYMLKFVCGFFFFFLSLSVCLSLSLSVCLSLSLSVSLSSFFFFFSKIWIRDRVVVFKTELLFNGFISLFIDLFICILWSSVPESTSVTMFPHTAVPKIDTPSQDMQRVIFSCFILVVSPAPPNWMTSSSVCVSQ